MIDPALNQSSVLDTLRQVIDPELGFNIVDLGLIYDVRIDGENVRVTMTVTSPGCPMQESIRRGVENALLQIEAVNTADVEIVFDPPWNPAMMTKEGRGVTGG